MTLTNTNSVALNRQLIQAGQMPSLNLSVGGEISLRHLTEPKQNFLTCVAKA